ncbi:MAG: endonuclease III [Planctomycetes bacterium]|nr:endonuclease III [Planctomycetota bacterium]
MESLKQKQARVTRIMRALKKAHPDARLDLDFESPLELLIALILAAQARDDVVNAITAVLFRKYRTAEDWADAKEEVLHEELRRINFYRNKTCSIQKACRTLLEQFDGEVPDTLDELLTLPGVGRKTANVLLGNAFAQPAIGVDTHVGRVSTRLGLTMHDDPDDIEADLTAIVPEKDRVKFCHLLQYHGRRICMKRKPACPKCPIKDMCDYPEKTAM